MYKDHGGDIYKYGNIRCDFSSNISPLGLPEGVKIAIKESIDLFEKYPDPRQEELRRKLSEKHGVPESNIVCGNGAADLIHRIPAALNGLGKEISSSVDKPTAGYSQSRKALVFAPAFSEYEGALKSSGIEVDYFFLRPEDDFSLDPESAIKKIKSENYDFVFLANPGNPTGITIPKDEIIRLANSCKEKSYLIIDECFLDFAEGEEELSSIKDLNSYPNMIILKSFTKVYAMAGLRLGYALFGNSADAEKVLNYGQPWSLSKPAEVAGLAALREQKYIENLKELISRERSKLETALRDLGFKVLSSDTNYIFFYDNGVSSSATYESNLKDELIKRGILIRDCGNYTGLGCGSYRIAVKTEEENHILIDAMKEIMDRS